MASGGARTNAIGFGNYAIGGGFGNQSQFCVDGVPSNAPANNVNSYVPAQDVVQEFRLDTNNVPAEYGNYAGGVVNLTTTVVVYYCSAVDGSPARYRGLPSRQLEAVVTCDGLKQQRVHDDHMELVSE